MNIDNIALHCYCNIVILNYKVVLAPVSRLRLPRVVVGFVGENNLKDSQRFYLICHRKKDYNYQFGYITINKKFLTALAAPYNTCQTEKRFNYQ